MKGAPGHKFAHVVIAQLSWHVQSRGLIWTLCFTLEQHVISQNLDYGFINYLWNGSMSLYWLNNMMFLKIFLKFRSNAICIYDSLEISSLNS